jgi:hypothetical protein
VIANLFYFDRPGVAFIGGISLGLIVISYFISVKFGRRD